MKRFFLLVVFLAMVPALLFSQDGNVDVSKWDAAIFRGPVVEAYPHYVRGTAYLNSSEFQKEMVVYNRKLYYNVKLNLDVFRDIVCVMVPESTIEMVLDSPLVKSFTLNGKEFVNASGTEGLERSFYEKLYGGGNMLLKETVKRYHRVDKGNVEFYSTVKYFLVKDGRAVRVKGMKAFKKLYPEKKKALRKYRIELSHTDQDLNNEMLYIALAKFADNS
ncbi:MAG: hypothetical protein J6Q34_03730 [Bacteroidales bacterium]|nr:hypothetical protein [Bacteroidales bacterium]